MASPGEQDARTTRRNGVAAKRRLRRRARAAGLRPVQAGLTSAIRPRQPETACGFGGAGGCVSSRPAEWGSTTGPPRGPGSRRAIALPCFRVIATELQMRKLTGRTPDMTPGIKNIGHTAEARYEQVAHRVSNSTKSGRTGRGGSGRGSRGQRRRRVPFPVPRRGTALPGGSGVRSRREGKGATGEPATPS